MVSEKSLSMRGRLNCLTVRCPECQQLWLVPGLAGGDEYVCKRCGAAFLNRGREAPRQTYDLLRPRTSPGAVETPA